MISFVATDAIVGDDADVDQFLSTLLLAACVCHFSVSVQACAQCTQSKFFFNAVIVFYSIFYAVNGIQAHLLYIVSVWNFIAQDVANDNGIDPKTIQETKVARLTYQ